MPKIYLPALHLIRNLVIADMFHTVHFPRRVCKTYLPQFNYISNSASRHKAKFDLSDDLTNGPHDLIGPPRPASNLRPVKFAVSILDRILKKDKKI